VRIVVVNAGSSSLKLSLIGDGDQALAETELGAPGEETTQAALDRFIASAGTVDAIGHRIVHGGAHLSEPRLIDEAVLGDLDVAADMAPLHDPCALALVRRLRTLAVPQVACFDTAFHKGIDAAAATYAIPALWREMGVRRYGFHGLSFAWATRRAVALLGASGPVSGMVIAHLGAGASVCAVDNGCSVDTTMGFTPVEGLVMATRSGSVDPGALLWLQTRRGISAESMNVALERESGWRALGGSADMRELVGRHDDRARLAVDVFVHSVRAAVAAMATALDHLDALVFTGGIGANSGEIRRRVVAGLGVVGISADIAEGAEDGEDGIISAPGAGVAVAVVRAREDLEIAREVRSLLG